MSQLTHKGRVVLVSGAGNGIGAAITERFCQAGATVALLDINEAQVKSKAEELRAKGYSVAWATANVADFDQCEQAYNALVAEVGPIDTLINNAGISPKTDGLPMPIWKMDPKEWTGVVDVNLNGAFNLARLASPSMVENKFGRIINMSSVAAKAYLPLVAAHYSATKAALIGFTRHLAGELGQYGITVNALAPGRIETPMLKMVAPEVNQQAVDNTALGRLGAPEEVAHMACYLTSDESAFITGQVVDVAGGWLMT
ncbi:SDR family oxidoreductase [Terasakiella pusilla]|uniref:SDR family oxidoreductase n=1 Tax=Terasakiella pusilla TaxID=64973 RepID=UPI00048CC332|nr:SDR family NAD(P)-dependent oxidoreductase [Terasakiella pusilla]